MRTLNHPPRRLTTNGYPIIDHNHRWHFTIPLNFSDRRLFNSDHAAPAQLYRGNLPHYYWPRRRVPLVRTLGRQESSDLNRTFKLGLANATRATAKTDRIPFS